jgi:hypothetical protein
MNQYSRFPQFIIFVFLILCAFNVVASNDKKRNPTDENAALRLCRRNFLPENEDLKLTPGQIKWIHRQTKSIESPLATMLVQFFSSNVDRAEFGQALGYALEHLSGTTVQSSAINYQKGKLSDFAHIHGGVLAPQDLMGKDIMAHVITTQAEEIIITRADQDMTSTTFRIYRFTKIYGKVKKMLSGQAFFSWPPKDIRRLFTADPATADKTYVQDAIELYFSDQIIADSLLAVLFPLRSNLTYRPQVIRAIERNELAAEEFLRKKQLFATAQALVAKVEKHKGQVISTEIGSHMHKIYITKLDANARKDLVPYQVGQFFKDGAEVLIAIDTHGEGRLTLIDVQELSNGKLNAYRESVDAKGVYSHLGLNSEDGSLYEVPDPSIDNLIDSIEILARDLR